jgi:guanidinopropionase
MCSIVHSRRVPAHLKGGLASWQAQAIIAAAQLIGMNLVEVSPAYDVAEITALAAATMVREYFCLLGDRGI